MGGTRAVGTCQTAPGFFRAWPTLLPEPALRTAPVLPVLSRVPRTRLRFPSSLLCASFEVLAGETSRRGGSGVDCSRAISPRSPVSGWSSTPVSSFTRRISTSGSSLSALPPQPLKACNVPYSCSRQFSSFRSFDFLSIYYNPPSTSLSRSASVCCGSRSTPPSVPPPATGRESPSASRKLSSTSVRSEKLRLPTGYPGVPSEPGRPRMSSCSSSLQGSAPSDARGLSRSASSSSFSLSVLPPCLSPSSSSLSVRPSESSPTAVSSYCVPVVSSSSVGLSRAGVASGFSYHIRGTVPASSLSTGSFYFPAASFPLPRDGPSVFLASSAPSSLTSRRFFGVGGSFGYDAFFRGASEVLNGSNVQLQHLPRAKGGGDEDSPRLHVARLPQQVKLLGAPYFFKKKRAAPLTFYHHLVDSPADVRGEETGGVLFHSGLGHSHCFVACPQASQLRSKTLENVVFEHTRGFACQLVLEGRGVKAYFDPEWPNLMVRLGVGVKPLALRRLAEQYATRAKIFVDKRGLILTVHGYDKCAVGTLTMSLFNHLQANPYTMKGAHVAMYPIKKKVSKKK